MDQIQYFVLTVCWHICIMVVTCVCVIHAQPYIVYILLLKYHECIASYLGIFAASGFFWAKTRRHENGE